MANEKTLPSKETLVNGHDHSASLITANDNYLRDTIYVSSTEPTGPHVHRGMIWIDTSVGPNAIKIRLVSSWATVTTVEKLLYGVDANKGATPDPGDLYIATDTEKIYSCFTDDVWTQIYPKIIEVALGTFTCPGATGNYSVTGLGFEPRLVEFKIGKSSTDYGGHGWMDYNGNQASFAIDIDGANKIACDNAKTVQATNFGVINYVVGAYVSMDVDGFTINFIAVDVGYTIYWKAIR